MSIILQKKGSGFSVKKGLLNYHRLEQGKKSKWVKCNETLKKTLVEKVTFD